MNKHHGSDFDDYLKEKGMFEEVSELAQKEWEALQAEVPDDIETLPEDSPGRFVRFFQWIRHAINL